MRPPGSRRQGGVQAREGVHPHGSDMIGSDDMAAVPTWSSSVGTADRTHFEKPEPLEGPHPWSYLVNDDRLGSLAYSSAALALVTMCGSSSCAGTTLALLS